MSIIPLGCNDRQIKKFNVIFIIDCILRCLIITRFGMGNLIPGLGFLAIFLTFMTCFFVYTLFQIYRTVKILYAEKLFLISPGWSVVIHLIFAHGVFGFILPIYIWIQARKYLEDDFKKGLIFKKEDNAST